MELKTATSVSLKQVQDLPTLPEVYQRLVAVLDDPRSLVWDAERIVRQDPPVTAKILRLVNSPLYGLRSPVTTIAQAVRTIGYDALKQLVLTTSVVSLFQQDRVAPLSYKAYWAHCLGTAVAARQLAFYLGEEYPEEFFVAGLLHDIGKLVHAQYFPEKFSAALALAAAERLTIEAAEQTILGISHVQTGGLLVHHWRLAPVIQRAVAYHHTPVFADFASLTLHEHVVHCANIISHSLGLGASGSHRLPPFVPLSWEILRLSPGHLANIVAVTKREFTQLMAILFTNDEAEQQQ
jgi:putative nucleotidyltransferase with HDIG domain